jgi:hypothetical protein
MKDQRSSDMSDGMQLMGLVVSTLFFPALIMGMLAYTAFGCIDAGEAISSERLQSISILRRSGLSPGNSERRPSCVLSNKGPPLSVGRRGSSWAAISAPTTGRNHPRS